MSQFPEYPPQYPQQPPPSQPGQPGYPPDAYGQQPGYVSGQPGYVPPEYYQQPGAPYVGQTGYPPPRRNRAGLWIGIVLILLLLVGGGTATYLVVQHLNSPSATLSRFCDGFKALDAQVVYDTFSHNLKADTSLKDIQDSFQDVKKSDCTVLQVTQDGSAATGTISISVTNQDGKTETDTGTANLIQEDGQWKIDELH